MCRVLLYKVYNNRYVLCKVKGVNMQISTSIRSKEIYYVRLKTKDHGAG